MLCLLLKLLLSAPLVSCRPIPFTPVRGLGRAGCGCCGLRQWRLAKDGFLRADASRQIELENKDFLVGMVNQETGLRGYVNNGDPSFLEPFVLGQREVQSALHDLYASVTDPGQLTELNRSRAAAEALEYIVATGAYASCDQAEQPKVILLDLKPPKVDGLEVLRRVKADPSTKSIPVVMLTSSREERDIIEGYRLGVKADKAA